MELQSRVALVLVLSDELDEICRPVKLVSRRVRSIALLRNIYLTRIHSSRMRTARNSSRPGGSAPAPLGADPPGADTPPQSRHPPLLTESQTPVKILPCPSFVAGGKNKAFGLLKPSIFSNYKVMLFLCCFSIGRSKRVCQRRVPPPPILGVQILSFSCSVWQKICKIIV